MERNFLFLFLILLSQSIFCQNSTGYWDKSRSIYKEVKLSAGQRTWHRIDIPLGTTQVVARITMLGKSQKITKSLTDLLINIPGPEAKALAAGTSLTSAVMGDDECSYRIFLSKKDADAYYINQTSNNSCKLGNSITHEVIYLDRGKGCINGNATSLYFAFQSENSVLDERIILELLPWIDEEASKGWTKDIKDNLYKEFVSAMVSAGAEKEEAQNVSQCIILKMQSNYTLPQIQNYSEPELNAVFKQLGEECVEEGGYYEAMAEDEQNTLAEEADKLAEDGKYGEAADKLLELINSVESPEAFYYNEIGYNLLLSKQFTRALKYLKEGEIKDETDLLIQGNLAHAYLLSGDFQKANFIYQKYRGQNVDAKTSWEDMVKEDYDAFKKLGISSSKFAEILNSFEAPKD